MYFVWPYKVCKKLSVPITKMRGFPQTAGVLALKTAGPHFTTVAGSDTGCLGFPSLHSDNLLVSPALESLNLAARLQARRAPHLASRGTSVTASILGSRGVFRSMSECSGTKSPFQPWQVCPPIQIVSPFLFAHLKSPPDPPAY